VCPAGPPDSVTVYVPASTVLLVPGAGAPGKESGVGPATVIVQSEETAVPPSSLTTVFTTVRVAGWGSPPAAAPKSSTNWPVAVLLA